MSGPRYSIIPRRFFEDPRPALSHTKVIGVLGTHSNETGWCRLKQRTISDSSTLARETVNRAIADLIEWGYVEKKDVKGRSSAYRVLMDASGPIPKDLPELEITCEAQITPPCDGTDHTGCDARDHTGCDVGSHNKNDPSLTINTKRSAAPTPAGSSEAGSMGLEVKKGSPAFRPEFILTVMDGAKWEAWIQHLRLQSDGLADKAQSAGSIAVTTKWPAAGSELLRVIGGGLTSKSRAMSGEDV